MSGIGISINVKTESLERARQSIKEFGSELSGFNKNDVSLGGSSMAKDAELLRQAAADISRMGSLARSGEAKGGSLNIGQWKEVEGVTTRVASNLDAWVNKTKSLQAELHKISENYKDLEHSTHDMETPENVRASNMSEMERLAANKGELEKQLQERSEKEPKVGNLQRRAQEHNNNIQGFEKPGSEGGGVGDGGIGVLGTGLKWGAALLGVGSVLSMIKDASALASHFDMGNADLTARGGSGLTDDRAYTWAKNFGYRPVEQLAIFDQLNRGTGAVDSREDGANGVLSRMAQMAMAHGRRMGIGGEAVANYTAGTFQSVKDITDLAKQPDGLVKVDQAMEKPIRLLHDTAVALGARGRIEEVLRLNQQFVSDVVRGRGGKEVTTEGQNQLAMMQMGLWAANGQIGRGRSGLNILETMDAGIRSGGNSESSQIFLSHALGIDNVKSLKDLGTYQRRKLEGASPRNVKATLDYAIRLAKERGLTGDDADFNITQNVAGATGLNLNQVDALMKPKFRKILDELAKGGSDSAYKSILDSEKGKKLLAEAKADADDVMDLPGNKNRAKDAALDAIEIPGGRKARLLENAVKGGAADVIDKIKKGLDENQNAWKADIEKHKNDPGKYYVVDKVKKYFRDTQAEMVKSDDDYRKRNNTDPKVLQKMDETIRAIKSLKTSTTPPMAPRFQQKKEAAH